MVGMLVNQAFATYHSIMSIVNLARITADTILTPHLITQLNQIDLLRCLSLRCSKHNIDLQLTQTDKVKDGFIMVCHRCRDGNQQSIRKDSWFSNRHHPIVSYIHAISLLEGRAQTSYIVKATDIARETIYQISADLAVRMDRYNKQHMPYWSGRNIVEVDVCHMKWKVKANGEAELDECPAGEGEWLIGLIERRSLECWIECITNRGQRAMIPVIESLVAPGTRIMSDAHETYKKLDHKYEHEVINKAKEGFSRYGRTRASSINVNKCENMWHHLRLFSHTKSYSSALSVHRIVHEYIFSKAKVSHFELVKIEQ